MEIKEQYGRVKGASWFSLLYKKDIMVLGQGGIGSWLSLLLSRIGVTLHTFDDDKYEGHNMTGQAVRSKDIGKLKTEAVKDIIAEFSPDCEVYTNGKYTNDSFSNAVVLCGFDNMNARKLAFKNWKAYVLREAYKRGCLFIDGRLNPEHMQILCIPGDRPDLIKEYEETYLFDDAAVADLECTFKQTSHSAAMIASHMVAFLTNWVYNSNKTVNVRQVPFYYEYVIPANLTTIK